MSADAVAERLAKGQATKREAAAERQQLTRELPGGYEFGPDGPPGIGWVLRLPRTPGREKPTSKGDYRRREFYLTEAQALAAYESHRRTDWTGWGPRPRPLRDAAGTGTGTG